MEYWIADVADAIVNEYLKFHPELIGANIRCIFKEKASTSDGVAIVGKIAKVSDKNKILMIEPYDYIIEIGQDAWTDLNNAQKEAWIDHILEHAYGEEDEKTGDMKWKTRNPDVGFFFNVVNRHGIHWMHNLPKIATLPFARGTEIDPPKKKNEDGTQEDIFADLTSDLN